MSMDSPEFRMWLGNRMAADAEVAAKRLADQAAQQDRIDKVEAINRARVARAQFTHDLAADVARVALGRKAKDLSIQGTAGWKLEPERVVRLGSQTVSFGRRGPNVTRDFLSRTGHLLGNWGLIYQYKLLGRHINDMHITSLERQVLIGQGSQHVGVEVIGYEDYRDIYETTSTYDSESLSVVGVDEICGPPVTERQLSDNPGLESRLSFALRYDEPNKYEAMLVDFVKGVMSPPTSGPGTG